MRLRGSWMCALCLLVACGGDKGKVTAEDAGALDAGSPQVNKKIAAVLDAGAPPAPTASGNGPPPKGVFAPGEADRAIAPGTPATIELLDRGSEPRVALRPLDAALPPELTITVGRKFDRQIVPPVEFHLALGEPPAGGKGKDGEKPPKTPPAPAASAAASARGSAAPAAPPSEGLVVVYHVSDLALAKTQAAGMPPELDKALKTLVGTRVELRVGPSGVILSAAAKPPKGITEGLEAFTEILVDAVAQFEVPAPDEPVGKGAYWMVSDRTLTARLPVLRYRVFRVAALEGSVAKLSVEIRQYLASAASLQPEGLPPNTPFDVTFDAVGRSELSLARGSIFPTAGQTQQPMQIGIVLPGGQQAKQTITTEALLGGGGVAPTLPEDDDE